MECISRLEREIADLRKTLVAKENELYELKKKWVGKSQQNMHHQENPDGLPSQVRLDKLPRWAIERCCKLITRSIWTLLGTAILERMATYFIRLRRYSRQILLPEIGVDGQVKLCAAKVLIVGAGGLGCPAAMYLAGAGVGELGLVDYDTVDLTNIHRQVLHGEADQGANKVDSAASALRRINSNITITPHNIQLDSNQALRLVSQYHVVLDCSDNVPTRYLLNDACAIAKLPLISGSALKMEGQLTVYGYRAPKDSNEKECQGPCYRCLFPTPPPPETVGSCSANGVAGPVPGVIGALQALEAIKLVVGRPQQNLLVERMLIFDGDDATFRTVKLRPRSADCAACSEAATVTQLLDYEVFCKTKAKEKDLDLQILPPSQRITAAELAARLPRRRPLLVDVRSAAEFAMCHIPGAVNYPRAARAASEELLEEIRNAEHGATFVCRRGNDSQVAARRALDAGGARVNDLVGGLHAWARDVDTNFPVY